MFGKTPVLTVVIFSLAALAAAAAFFSTPQKLCETHSLAPWIGCL